MPLIVMTPWCVSSVGYDAVSISDYVASKVRWFMNDGLEGVMV